MFKTGLDQNSFNFSEDHNDIIFDHKYHMDLFI